MSRPASSRHQARIHGPHRMQVLDRFATGPYSMHKTNLGTFKWEQPEPRIHVKYSGSGSQAVSYHDVKIERPDGTYTLYRQFQNWEDVAHEIAVTLATFDSR